MQYLMTLATRRVTMGAQLLATCLVLAGCSVLDTLHGEEAGTIIPALRYVMDYDGNRYYEDISGGNVEVVVQPNVLPVGVGPMQVDCHTTREIGVIVRYGPVGGSGYGHDYDYAASWPDANAQEIKHFTYEKRWGSLFKRGAARFREPLRNGRIALSATHRKEVIYTTEFEVVGC